MAADSVQVGKVDNCCEKCAKLLQRLQHKVSKQRDPGEAESLRVLGVVFVSVLT